jgi:hypothetical protein
MPRRALRYRSFRLVAALLIAGCAEQPRFPLLSPIAQAKSYGYGETAKGAGHYAVIYATPVLTSSSAPDVQDREAEALRAQALDFALWRAALVAQAAGYEGFRMADKRTDIDTLPEPVYYDRDFYGPFGGVGVNTFGFNRSLGVGVGAGLGFTPPPASPYTHRRARASIDIELVRALAPGDYRAADVLAQAQRAYPTATQVPRP